ncbi:MAG: hypothetical protein ACOCP8_06715 [archaeon]
MDKIEKFVKIKENCPEVKEGGINIGVGKIDKCGIYPFRNIRCDEDHCPKMEER